VLRVGLTGGIAAGKSTASARFTALGATVIDYDVLARDAVAPGSPGLAAVVGRFSATILNPDGSLNREALGHLIFADSKARQDLENIIHPEVYRLATAAESQALVNNPDALIVHDIPLLVEQNLSKRFDVVIAVITETSIRIQRLIETRGFSEATATARIAAAAKDYQRAEVADLILDGSGTPAQLNAQVDHVWELLTSSGFRGATAVPAAK